MVQVKSQVQQIYSIIESQLQLEDGVAVATYGIMQFSINGCEVTKLATIRDISEKPEDIARLIDRLTGAEIETAVLFEVVEDFVAELSQL